MEVFGSDRYQESNRAALDLVRRPRYHHNNLLLDGTLINAPRLPSTRLVIVGADTIHPRERAPKEPSYEGRERKREHHVG